MSDFVPKSEYPDEIDWSEERLTVDAMERRVASWSDAQCRAVRLLDLEDNELPAVPACVLRFVNLEV